MTLRPACYNCKFKFTNIKSDITLADAWGVQQFAPDMIDNKLGTSLIVISTPKGKNFFSKLPLAVKPINFDVLSTQKANLFTSTTPHALRKNFFNDLKNFPDMPIQVMQKYFVENPNKIEEPGRNIYREGYQKYAAILQHIAKLRGKNLMLITPINDAKILNNLIQDVAKNFKGVGIYLLQLRDKGNALLIDILHPFMKFDVKMNLLELRGLIENFHLNDILLDNQIKFNAESIKFLESNGTTIKNFDI